MSWNIDQLIDAAQGDFPEAKIVNAETFRYASRKLSDDWSVDCLSEVFVVPKDEKPFAVTYGCKFNQNWDLIL